MGIEDKEVVPTRGLWDESLAMCYNKGFNDTINEAKISGKYRAESMKCPLFLSYELAQQWKRGHRHAISQLFD